MFRLGREEFLEREDLRAVAVMLAKMVEIFQMEDLMGILGKEQRR